MKYSDLRDFIRQLERENELKKIVVSVSPNLESDGNLKSRPSAQRTGLAVHESGRFFHTGADQSFRQCPAYCQSRRRRNGSGFKTHRPVSGVAERTGTAGTTVGCVRYGSDAEILSEHETEALQRGVLSGDRTGRGCRRSGVFADSAMLAGRCRSADHLGNGRHARTMKDKIWASTASKSLDETRCCR